MLAVAGIYAWAWRGLTRSNTFIDLPHPRAPQLLIAVTVAFTTGMGLMARPS